MYKQITHRGLILDVHYEDYDTPQITSIECNGVDLFELYDTFYTENNGVKCFALYNELIELL